VWSALWNAAWTSASDSRRSPEAFGKDGCPAQHTAQAAASTHKCRSCLAPLAAALQSTNGLSEAITPPPSSSFPGDVWRGLPEGTGAEPRAFGVQDEHAHAVGRALSTGSLRVTGLSRDKRRVRDSDVRVVF